MQSGITVSADLHDAFTTFTSDTSIFCLPITITSEALTPLPSIPFPNATSALYTSLHKLSDLLNPTTPLYLVLRKNPSATSPVVALTYIPSRAPVRQKTLFASTRSTLVRDLGSEKFAETIFLTEREEILDTAQWDEREKSNAAASASAHQSSGGVDTRLLSAEERELQAVKRAEEEERHGTRGRDLMNEGGSGANWIGARDGEGASRSGIMMKTTDEAKTALSQFTSESGGGGRLVQFGIDVPSETLMLLSSKSDVSPDAVTGHIPSDRPSYTFYSVPSTVATPGVIFIYVCPGTSKVKERMVHASSRLGVVKIAKGQGIEVLKTLEAGEPDELKDRIGEEVRELSVAAGGLAGGLGDDGEDSAPGSGTATPRGGFARPKRPGRR